MTLPLPESYEPMEAKPVSDIPAGDEWQYEPKWDGFRCIAFRDGEHIELMSKGGKPLTRYFPELVTALHAVKTRRFVLDGEIVIAEGKSLAFDQLLQRIHPAESRIRKLSAEHPASYLLFDMLVDSNGKLLANQPLAVRRKALEKFASKLRRRRCPTRCGCRPRPTDLATVKRWFDTVGSGLDGIIAKRVDLPYQSGARTGMQKIKHTWTADCVVGGFRYASKGKQVGSLCLACTTTTACSITSDFCRESSRPIARR